MAGVARSLDSECAVFSLGSDQLTSLQSPAEGDWPPFRGCPRAHLLQKHTAVQAFVSAASCTFRNKFASAT